MVTLDLAARNRLKTTAAILNPVIPGKRYLDWELDDPADKDVAQVRPVRDDIEQRVRGLMGELDVEPAR